MQAKTDRKRKEYKQTLGDNSDAKFNDHADPDNQRRELDGIPERVTIVTDPEHITKRKEQVFE